MIWRFCKYFFEINYVNNITFAKQGNIQVLIKEHIGVQMVVVRFFGDGEVLGEGLGRHR